MGSYTPPSEPGKRLLHVTIDEIARDSPQRAWASLPISDDDLSPGFTDISYQTYANGINKLCWFIEKAFGPSHRRFPTVCYLGLPDVRYHFLQMAAAKTGYQVFFSSHMNSHTAHLALMEKTNTVGLLSAHGVAVKDLLEERPVPHFLVPELEDLLEPTPAKHYPYTKTFEEAKDDPYLILHSSGTTGLPKPLVWNHGALAAVDACRQLSDYDETTGQTRRFIATHPGPGRMFCPFLPFHGICSVAMMIMTVFGETTYVPGFRHRVVEREHCPVLLARSRATAAVLSPAMAEDLAASPDVERFLKPLKFVMIGGAACTKVAADTIRKYTSLDNVWGTTETMKVPDYFVSPSDFSYLAFDMKHSGADFRDLGDGTYQLFFKKTADSFPYLAAFHRVPGSTEHDTGDVWRPHSDPRKAAFTWQFAGRADDLISYKDGNNFMPIAYELKHAEHPLIRAAVISGVGHRQPVLQLEPCDFSQTANAAARQKLLDQIWEESVAKVNEVAPKNGQIKKTHVVFSTEEKRFERTVKGTVSRKKTMEKFRQEIEECYRVGGDETMDVSERLEGVDRTH